METVFRVKRRRDEEPSEALLVTCKRSKQSDEKTCSVPVAALLKFAATVDKQVNLHFTQIFYCLVIVINTILY